MNPSIANLGTMWERREIRNPTGATEADIVAFEAKYDVKLAPIVRGYFSEINGTKVGELGMDDEYLIGFWHLEQVPPMKEECPQFVTAQEPNLFIFADYSIWAHGYAIRLGPTDAETAIFLIGGTRPLRIARTFEEFLQKYAAGDEGMLFGSGEVWNPESL